METAPTHTVKHSFGFDLYSIIGEDLFESSILLTALADKELPWGQVAFACRMGCLAAARAALSLRTFSELTNTKIDRKVQSVDQTETVDLYKLLGLLVHHQRMEIEVDPPLQRIPVSKQNLAVKDQTVHRLVGFSVASDKGRAKVSLSALAQAIFDEVNIQINTPEAKDLKEAHNGRSR